MNKTGFRKHLSRSMAVFSASAARKSRIKSFAPAVYAFHSGTGRFPSFRMEQPCANMVKESCASALFCIS
ncbi:MAG: hypothetical protein EGQ81_03735 [Akkermansia sp.]|nr:hypothetical protein [Akkermansia sp.]